MPMSDWPMCDVEPDQRPADIPRLHPRCKTVRFMEPLRTATYQRLAHVMQGRSDVGLTLWGYSEIPGDLEFLKWFPSLKRFRLANSFVSNLDGLKYLPPDLFSLSIGYTQKPLDLQVLSRFRSLRILNIRKHVKNLDVIKTLSKLRDLTLLEITLPNLALIAALPQLRVLEINFGGTSNLKHLAHARALRYLEICQVRMLADLSVLAQIEKLCFAGLRALRNVRELPSFKNSKHLRYLALWKMRGLTNFSPIADAPNLKELCLIDMGHIDVEDLRPLVGHKSLQKVNYGLGGDKKNVAAEQFIGRDWSGAAMSDLPKLRTKLRGLSP